MTRLIAFVVCFVLACCTQPNSTESNNDSTDTRSLDTSESAFEKRADSVPQANSDTSLVRLTDTILTYIKDRDFARISQFVHPISGVRFSPYGNIDTAKNLKFTAQQLTTLGKNSKKMNWGIYDGTGEPIDLSISKYFDRFVYDVDFLIAENKSVAKTVGSGISSEKLKSVYPQSNFVQYYFSGFNEKYQGMDWKSLILVVENYNSKPYLIGIIHDQWKS